MTKTELINFTDDLYNLQREDYSTRVLTCKAELLTYSSYDCILLKSYETIVGIYKISTGTMYIFDYYSQTTIQHIYKACLMLKADRITWLYKRSDNCIELAVSAYANTHRLSNKEFKKVIENDYITYIGSFPEFKY